MYRQWSKYHRAWGFREDVCSISHCWIPQNNGSESYLFISYSHKDAIQVYDEIKFLDKQGFHIWYDEGIPLSEKWGKKIVRAIKSCTVFIVFITENSIISENIINEIHLALKYKKNQLIPIYLENTTLPDELEYSLLRIQSLMKYKIHPDHYHSKLIQDLKSILEKGC